MSVSSVSSSAPSSIFRLCGGAEDCIQAMHLIPEEQEFIRNCISHYSMPDTFCGTLNWLIFRTINAFKSVFPGQMSEWQNAKKVAQERGLEIAIQRGVVQRSPSDEARQAFKDNTIEVLEGFADKLLDVCLEAEDKGIKSSDRLKQIVQQVDLIYLLDHQLKDIADVLNRRLQS